MREGGRGGGTGAGDGARHPPFIVHPTVNLPLQDIVHGSVQQHRSSTRKQGTAYRVPVDHADFLCGSPTGDTSYQNTAVGQVVRTGHQERIYSTFERGAAAHEVRISDLTARA